MSSTSPASPDATTDLEVSPQLLALMGRVAGRKPFGRLTTQDQIARSIRAGRTEAELEDLLTDAMTGRQHEFQPVEQWMIAQFVLDTAEQLKAGCALVALARKILQLSRLALRFAHIGEQIPVISVVLRDTDDPENAREVGGAIAANPDAWTGYTWLLSNARAVSGGDQS